MELIDAAKALVDKLKLINANREFNSVWVFMANHGCPYTGPNYKQELDDLIGAFDRLPDGCVARVAIDRPCGKCGVLMRDIYSTEITACGGCDIQ